MRSDLDAVMQANNIDALLVTGPAQHNPAMVYFTGVCHLSIADLIKKRGEPPVLFHTAMERGEAANAARQNGLLTRGFSNYPYKERLEAAGGSPVGAEALRYIRMLADQGITSGRVALYGQAGLNTAFPVFYELQKRMPEITLIGDLENVILGTAMTTKDDVEIERIRSMGKITTEVVGKVADYLTSRSVRGDMLLGSDGEPLTLGQVKGLINLWLAERGAETPEGTIFSIGRDAALPHSIGNPLDLMRLGQTIVFDIYPCEAGGGYFYDFTRTWSLGYATDEAQALYDQVLSVYQILMRELKSGAPYSDYQNRACALFEAMGHATQRTDPNNESGYVHGIGHGVGLNIHERPSSSLITSLPEDKLIPQVVITIEPGLYYPERGMGVRLEDTVIACADGTFQIPVEYPLDFILPMKKSPSGLAGA